MLFAAGLGTRLRPLTNDRPKALVEVNGKSLLELNILKLKAAGFEHIVVNVHHFADQIIDFLHSKENFGINIQVSDEREQLLDTGGGIRKALPFFDCTQPILIHNVDIISNIDLDRLYSSHLGAATLAINQRSTSRYLMFDKDASLCGWTNISTGEVKGSVGEKFAFAGIHVIGKELCDKLLEMPDGSFPILPFYIASCNHLQLNGYDVTGAAWVDCGKVESLSKAAEILASS